MQVSPRHLLRLIGVGAIAVSTSVVLATTLPVGAAPIGPDDFQISQSGNDHRQPSVAYNATDDEYLAVWDQLVAGESQIFGRRISGAGAPIGNEFFIAALSPGDPTAFVEEPHVVWNSVDNEYVVVFEGDATIDGGGSFVTTFEIYAIRVTAAGAPVGGPVVVSDVGNDVDATNGSFDGTEAAIAHDPVRNEYLVVWRADDDDAGLSNNEFEIFGQRLTNALAEIGTDTQYSDIGPAADNSHDAVSPAVAYLGGEYLIVWEGDDVTPNATEIHGQFVDSATGSENGVNDFVISVSVANQEAEEPQVAASTDNSEFLVVWKDTAASDLEIHGAEVSSAGAVSPFAISSNGVGLGFSLDTVDVDYHTDTTLFSVTWAGEQTGVTGADEFEVFHVFWDPDTSSTVGSIDRITNHGTDGVLDVTVEEPAVATGADGTALVVFDANSPSDIFGQLVGMEADLSITKTLVTATNPGPGDAVSYTINYQNNGPGTASSITITDVIPAGLDFVSSVPLPTTNVGGTLTWDVATLAASGSGVITVNFSVNGTATDGQMIVNSASIASTGPTVDPVAGNDSGAAAAITVDFPPSVTIDQAAGQVDPTNAGPIDFDVVFSEDVTGFDSPADVTIGGTAPGMLTAAITPVSATDYTVTVSGMTGDGTVTASIAAGVAADLGGKPNTASTSTDNEVTLDTMAPTPTISTAEPDPTNADPIAIAIDFDEPVGNFDATDLAVTNGTLSDFAGSGANYTANVNPTADGLVTVSMTAAQNVTDLAGNASNAGNTLSLTYDGTAPTPTIAATEPDPTNADPIAITIDFDESVTGFVSGDITVGNGTVENFAGTGANYTADIIPTADGPVTVDVTAAVATDAAGNGNVAATQLSLTFDGTAPTPTITSAEADPTPSDPFDVTIDFGETVSGFVIGDITVGNGSATAFSDDGGGSFTATIDATADGQVTVDVAAAVAADGAGNDNLAATQFAIEVDTLAPTSVTVQAAGQADPTNGASVMFTVTFNEDVTGFDATDVVLGGTAPGTLAATVTGGPQVYGVEITGYTGDGTVTANVFNGAAVDAAGNTSVAMPSPDFEVTVDLTAPTVAVEQGATQADPANAQPIVFDVVFSEDVTGFDSTDVVVGGTATGPAVVAVTPLSATTYTVEVSGLTGDGTVTASIGAAAAADAAGNDSEASTSVDGEVTYDGTAPTVTVEQGATQTDTANAEPIVFDVVFSEPVTGFGPAAVTLSGTAGATTAVVAGSGDTYTVSVTGMTTDGTVVADVVADAATDAAGNLSEASTSVDNSVTYIAGDVTPGVNDPPVVTAPAAAAAELADVLAFTGADAVSVTDPDALDNDIVVTLTADDAETVITVTEVAGVVVGSNGTDAVTIAGPQGLINDALAGLEVVANNTGTVTVTVAADDQGNTDGAALTDSVDIAITVTDTVAPTITVPTLGVSADNDPGEAGAVVTYSASVDDPGSQPAGLIELQPAPTLTCTPAAGSFFPIGDTTVTCTATDASGNTSVESFVVTVNDVEDPVISGAVDQTFTFGDALTGVLYTAPTATDNSGSATVTCDPPSGFAGGTGQHTITCTASDPSGNTATASFVVTANPAPVLPRTGGSTTLLPWALALLAIGIVLVGSARATRPIR